MNYLCNKLLVNCKYLYVNGINATYYHIPALGNLAVPTVPLLIKSHLKIL